MISHENFIQSIVLLQSMKNFVQDYIIPNHLERSSKIYILTTFTVFKEKYGIPEKSKIKSAFC